MYYTTMDSPIGGLTLAGTQHALKVLGFSSGRQARGPDASWHRLEAPFEEAKQQLQEYFDGSRQHFELYLEPDATPFQTTVLAALQRIPYGETRSYRDIAEAIGNPKAMRAVGNANGSNPIPIIIPCHRVIGADGSLTGFGGGLDSKRFLLDLERSHSRLFAATSQAAAPAVLPK